MGVWLYAQPLAGVTAEVEFHYDDWRIAHHPTVMAWLDREDLGSAIFPDAPVRELHMDFALGEKAHVGVHAVVRADLRFHVLRPAEAHGIDHPLHPAVADRNHIDGDPSDHAMVGTQHWRY